MTNRPDSNAVIEGRFYTDGSVFVFRLEGTPLSGVGATPQAAFEDLTRARVGAADLPGKLAALASEQRSEAVRATLLRGALTALIVFGVVGGALAGAAALAPSVARDLIEVATGSLGEWLDEMTPADEQRLAELRRKLLSAGDTAFVCRLDPEAGSPAPP